VQRSTHLHLPSPRAAVLEGSLQPKAPCRQWLKKSKCSLLVLFWGEATNPASSVHLQIHEHLSVQLARDSSLESLDLKGDLHLLLATGGQISPIRIFLSDPETATNLVFKQHPKVAKFNPDTGERVIQHKNASDTFPTGQPLGLLRWKVPGKKDEGYLPLAINCWPTPTNDGKWDVTIEYELEKEELSIYDLSIEVPIP